MIESYPKVMFVIDSLGAGGAERSLVELLPHLISVGIEPLVVTLKSVDVGFEKDAHATGTRIISIGTENLVGRVRALRRLIEEEAPSLVHTTLYDSNIAGRLASAGLDVAVSTSLVSTSYDSAHLSDPNVSRLKLALARRLDAWTARRFCDQFHAITHAVKESSVRTLRIDPHTVTVIHRSRDLARLGIPSRERRDAVRRKLSLVQDQPVLLNIGRHEHAKGHGYLIRAISLLVETHSDLILLVAGREGKLTESIESDIKSYGLDSSVRLLGHREDIGDLLSAADVFVFPSLYEGLGGSLLEALSMGVPVVASDIPAIREVVGQHAALVTPGDPQEIAAAISSVLVDASRTASRGYDVPELPSGFEQDRVAADMAKFFLRASGVPAAGPSLDE